MIKILFTGLVLYLAYHWWVKPKLNPPASQEREDIVDIDYEEVDE